MKILDTAKTYLPAAQVFSLIGIAVSGTWWVSSVQAEVKAHGQWIAERKQSLRDGVIAAERQVEILGSIRDRLARIEGKLEAIREATK